MQISGEKVIENLKDSMKRFFREEDGQTTTEYILLLAVVAFIIMRLKTTMQQKLEGLVNTAFDRAGAEIGNGQ